MERLVCLALICVVSTLAQDSVDPRGARPVEQGTRDEKCASQKEWPFCTDDEWGSKCPSGCRIQGLMDTSDRSLQKKIEKIRSLLDQNKAKHRSADQVSKQTYDSLKDKLIIDSGNDNNYYELAQSLRQRITDMKIKIDRQLRILAALKDRVKDQVVEMQRLEVDIDIKLRSCKGSCASYSEYQVDRESYEALNKQVSQLDNQMSKGSVGTLYVMKSKPLQGVLVDNIYKSQGVDGQRKESLFPEVQAVQLILTQEGSSTSPATISKDSGTSLSPSTSSSDKSITEFGGVEFYGGGGSQPSMSSTSTSTSTITCTKRTRTTVVHTKDGPVEKVEEVMEGGPECQLIAELGDGGTDSLFTSFSHPSTSSSSSSSSSYSSSSSSTSSNPQSGGTKGSILGDSKGSSGNTFDMAGFDLGGFMMGQGEDDVPDFQARSVKSTRVERQADYIGQDCVEAYRNHLKGETNGLFKIKPGGTDSMKVVEVYCQQEGLMGGWLLVQQRESGTLTFNRTWAEYHSGFGSVDAGGKGEFWLGNQNLHLLTNRGETIMKVELEDWEGGMASAEYTVRIGSEEEGYPLHVSGYTGDAGDALASHSGMKFSTFDKDNDKWHNNCAEMYGGGWWYNNCQSANLNGLYYQGRYKPENSTPYEVSNGVTWGTYKTLNYSLKSVRMSIRSTAF